MYLPVFTFSGPFQIFEIHMYVRTYMYVEWNGIERMLPCVIHSASVRDPFSIRARSVRHLCEIRSASVRDPFDIRSSSVQ